MKDPDTQNDEVEEASTRSAQSDTDNLKIRSTKKREKKALGKKNNKTSASKSKVIIVVSKEPQTVEEVIIEKFQRMNIDSNAVGEKRKFVLIDEDPDEYSEDDNKKYKKGLNKRIKKA